MQSRPAFYFNTKGMGAMDTPITRAEHMEFVKRVEAEDTRQNARISEIEESIKETHKQNASIERLAASVESIAKELERHGEKLEVLEARDGELWRKAIGYVVTSIISIVIGFIFSQIGM